MPITFNKEQNLFSISSRHTTYVIAITDETYLCHAYYGKRIGGADFRYLLREDEAPFVPSRNKREKNSFLDMAPMEYPETGMGDYRESAFCMRNVTGHRASELKYKEHRILEGKSELEGLPATFGTKEECTTLQIICEDMLTKVEVCLQYTIFEEEDALTRSVLVENKGTETVYLEKVLSACLDMADQKFEAVSLHGSWARERHIQRTPLSYGRFNAASFKGESSHQEHPFLALVTPDTTQTAGEVYAMNFVYSGNFIGQVEKNQFDSVRMTMGIHPEGFEWKLLPGESFTAPEVVLVYSDEGLGKMTRCFHDLYRSHLIRSPYVHKKRPVYVP